MIRLTIATALVAVLAIGPAWAQTSANPSSSAQPSSQVSPGSGATGASSDATVGTAGSTAQPGSTQASSGQKLEGKDKDFVHDGLKANHMEIQMGQLAQQRGQSDQVKQYAQRLIQDHQKARQQLQQIAQSRGVEIKLEDPQERAKEVSEKLADASGAEFDKKFMEDQVKHHEKDIKKFEEFAREAKDPQLKQFATQALPILRQHLEWAQQIRDGRQVTFQPAPGTSTYGGTSPAPASGGMTPGQSGTGTRDAQPGQTGTGIPGQSVAPGEKNKTAPQSDASESDM